MPRRPVRCAVRKVPLERVSRSLGETMRYLVVLQVEWLGRGIGQRDMARVRVKADMLIW